MGTQPPEPELALPRVIIPLSVTERFTREIQNHPRVEVGGKYVGFLRGGARYKTLDERRLALRELTIEVTDYLDDGPEAHRAPSFHRGDACWQTAEFRKLEKLQPEIEQLGSWHSHHPNGLPELSPRDIQGYQETVNHSGHNHDFFLVSLGIDLRGFATARHYLFVRGSKQYFELSRTSIQVVAQSPVDDAVTADGKGTPAAEKAPTSETAEKSEQQPLVGIQRAFVPTVSPSSTARPASEDDGQSAARHDGNLRSRSVPGWSESLEGRNILSAEYELLSRPEFAHLRLSLSQGRLLAKGWVDTSIGRISVSLLYPSAVDRQDGLLKLATIDEPVIDTTVSRELVRGLDGIRVALKTFMDYVVQCRRPLDRERQSMLTRFRNITGLG